MSSSAITTIVKMVESLPEPAQVLVVEHLREYIADLEDEHEWDQQFQNTQAQLIAAARRAKAESAQGKAQPLDYEQL